MKRLCLLVNPRSGKGLAQQNTYKMVEFFHKEGWLCTVIPVAVEPNMPARLGSGLEDFDLIVCCGGDGTLNHTATSLLGLENPPMLAYLPMGSTNDFASTLGYFDDLMQNCNLALHGKPSQLDIGMMNGESPFCYIAAFGAFTAVSYSTPQGMKNNLGHTAYIIEGLRHLPINTIIHAKITTPLETLEGDFIYGSFTNTTSVGGFHTPKGKDVLLNDGKFELLLISKPKSIADLNNLVACLAQQNFSNPYIRLIQSEQVNIEFDTPVSFTLDGEFGGELTQATLEVVPQRLWMHLPDDAPLKQEE